MSKPEANKDRIGWRPFFLAVLLPLLFITTPAHADTRRMDLSEPPFGAYSEKLLDLEVKVEGGTIYLWRTWQGGKADRNNWQLNRHHKPLQLEPFYSMDDDGWRYPAKIRHGNKSYNCLPAYGKLCLPEDSLDDYRDTLPASAAQLM